VQRALVVVAADRTGRAGPILAALGALDEPAGALDEAEARAILTISGDSVRFRHTLLRPLAYRLVAAASRRAAHRALAAALDAPEQAAERAWQPVASCAGPDEAVAATLDRVAEAERRRGAPAAAAATLEHAARLSVDASARQGRLQAAAIPISTPSTSTPRCTRRARSPSAMPTVAISSSPRRSSCGTGRTRRSPSRPMIRRCGPTFIWTPVGLTTPAPRCGALRRRERVR